MTSEKKPTEAKEVSKTVTEEKEEVPKYKSMNLHERLSLIQSKMKVPKNQTNKFGNYKYRSCEDIVETIKPFLNDLGMTLVISDEVVLVGERYYIQATATLTDAETGNFVCNKAYAREEDSKKGMDASQLSGATSSYARKYCLNGLLAIDDTKDADATNTHGKAEQKASQEAPESFVAKDNPIANEFIGEDETNSLKGEFKRTGIGEPIVLKEYGLELLSEMRMKDFYDCIRKFEQYPTKKTTTGIK